MKRARLLAVVLLFITTSFAVATILPERAKATTLYVGGAGPGNYTTIQGAIDDASPGNTVFVYSGAYYEHITIDKPISLIGQDRVSTVLDGGGTATVIHVIADWVNITNLNVTNGGFGWRNASIALDSVRNCYVANNSASSSQVGIYLDIAGFHTILDNIVSGNINGIWSKSSTGNTIAHNHVSSSELNNIRIDKSWAEMILSNTVTDSRSGISLSSAQNIIVANNSASGNNYGVSLYQSAGNTVVNNTVSDNWGGISLRYSDDNTIQDNTVFLHTLEAIRVHESHRNTLLNNTMIGNGIFISGDSVGHWNTHTIDTSNTVNGKSVYYWKDIDGGTVPLDAGQVILANCVNVVVENQTINHASVGIELGFSSNNTIMNNTASSNNQFGIYAVFSHDNTIQMNNASGNGWTGIALGDSNHDTVAENTVESNGNNGIGLYDSYNTVITENTAIANGYGIWLSDSGNTTVTSNSMERNGIFIDSYGLHHWNTHSIDTSNTVNGRPVVFWKDVKGGSVALDAGQVVLANCTDVIVENQNISEASVGIVLGFSSNNTIINNTLSKNRRGVNLKQSMNNTLYHNSFHSNWQQAVDYYFGNEWDDGYPSGGNFWSDYSGLDEKSGPNQDQEGGDGIGDTPHTVPGWDITDRYPLMNSPWPLQPSEPLDLQVIGGDQEISLEWKAPTSNGGSPITNYTIYRGTSPGSEVFLDEIGNILNYTDTGLTNGQTYYYTVSAKNTLGEGPQSSEVNAIPYEPFQNEPPACSILDPVLGTTVSGIYTIIGAAEDPDGTVESVEIKIDDGPWTPALGETLWTYEWNTTGVPDGNHTIHARSFDGMNHSDEVNVLIVVENTVPPPPPEIEESVFEQIWFWVAVVLVVVLLAIALLLVRRGRRELEE